MPKQSERHKMPSATGHRIEWRVKTTREGNRADFSVSVPIYLHEDVAAFLMDLRGQ